MNASVAMSGRERAALWDRLRPGLSGDDAELTARVIWSVLAEPGDGIAGQMIADLGAAPALRLVLRRNAFATAAALRAEATAIARAVAQAYDEQGREPLPGVRAGFLRWHPRMTGTLIETVFAMAAASRCTLLTPADQHWPPGMSDLNDHAPLVLWCLGDPALLAEFSHAVALVGTRASTGYGTHVATELAAGLADRDWTVVSGGAYGIDAAAHRAALAAKGRTVAVMAGGLNSFYPRGNSELLARVARDGAVVAEVPFGTPPTPFRFLARNRLIAAMASATVVVEAGRRSGSINTANHCGELGRPLGAVPGPITSPTSGGCHYLLREQPAQLVTSVEDVVELASGREGPAPEPLADPDDPRYGRVITALSATRARRLSDVAARCGLSETEAATLLGVLLLDGTVRSGDAGWVSVPRRE
ncbi:DNA-processing protein DprA [Gryllotalpicola reticulitermitis]|uniref:DNA-processing protein DprA n=1 Tax=Gryllotalpicola reticulitermitis TaxID=1184153 RepID=A0ABV8Q5V8_9MICO